MPPKISGRRRGLRREQSSLEGVGYPWLPKMGLSPCRGESGSSSGTDARSGGRCGCCSLNAPSFISLWEKRSPEGLPARPRRGQVGTQRISPHTGSARPVAAMPGLEDRGIALATGSGRAPASQPGRDPAEPRGRPRGAAPDGRGVPGQEPRSHFPRARAAPEAPFVIPEPTNKRRTIERIS